MQRTIFLGSKKNFKIILGALIFIVHKSSSDVHAHILVISRQHRIRKIDRQRLMDQCQNDVKITLCNPETSSKVFCKYLLQEKNLNLFNPDNLEIDYFCKSQLMKMKY